MLKFLIVFVLLALSLSLVTNALFALHKRGHPHTFIHNKGARPILVLLLSIPTALVLDVLLPEADFNALFVELLLVLGLLVALVVALRLHHSAPSVLLMRRVLIYGCGKAAQDVAQAIVKHDRFIQICGHVRAQGEEECCVSDDMLVKVESDLTTTARKLDVDEIIVAVVERRGGVLPLKELLDCKLNGIQVRDLASHFESFLGQIRLDALKPSYLIFGNGFSQTAIRNFFKRFFDILCSLILLVLASPIMLLTAIAIVVENGAPIFYRQERVGHAGRTFNVIKFRSMRIDAESDGKPRWAVSGDSRVTRVGLVIRKLRIDELPQLFCVLGGTMSLVGPRPERPYFVNELSEKIPYYLARHSVKPGVTGWAQVRYQYGASLEDSANKLQYDLYYVKNHSLLLDFMILFETVYVVLTGKGAQ